MRLTTRSCGFVLGCLVLFVPTQIWAQTRTSRSVSKELESTLSTGSSFGYNPDMIGVLSSASVRRAPTVAGVSRQYTRGLGLASRTIGTGGPRSKPFSNVQRKPTLSPYLNLLRNDGADMGGLPNYYTFVRPMQQQQRANRRTNRQLQGLNREVEAVNRQLMFQTAESSAIRPTGHPTVFMNHSHYYTFPR